MTRSPVSTPAGVSPTVLGLELGRKRAQDNARRQRRKNMFVNGGLMLVAAAFVAFGGFVGWYVYQASEDEPTSETDYRLTPTEAIERLEEQPRWNGPGNPAFGVGGEP